MDISEQRAAVVKEAREWEGTPYHHGAGLKKIGTSCSWFIAAVFNNALGANLTVVEHAEQWYLSDINIKTKNNLYLNELQRHGFIEILEEDRGPGDLLLSRTNNVLYCHGGIILAWPSVAHTIVGRGVDICRSAYSSWYFGQDIKSLKFYSWKEWHV